MTTQGTLKNARLSYALLVGALFSLTATAQQTTPSQPADDDEEVLVLSTFKVSGVQDDGYRSIQTISGSRTVENLKDVANSISILNRELMDDLAVTTMAELSEFAVTGERNSDPQNQEQYVFRGIVNSYQLRDGFIWYMPVDTFNLERVEILRGPNAFLYGEADPGGSLNQLTKRAGDKNFNKARVMVGSYDLYRGELDFNRKLNDQLSMRVNAAYQTASSPINYVNRDFQGLALAFKYQPFARTTIDVTYEYGKTTENRATPMLVERFSTTALVGSTTLLSNTAGGPTLFSNSGNIYNMVNTRVSQGQSIFLADDHLLPRQYNFDGPDATFNTDSQAFNISVEQLIGEKFQLEAIFNFQSSHADRMGVSGNYLGIYRDVTVTLPDGTANPNFGEFFTERYYAQRVRSNVVRDWRLSAVYDLELPFTTQRIVANLLQHQDNPTQSTYSEFVDPSSSFFSGSFIDANTKAAHASNNTITQRNFFRRRHYLNAGDDAALTAFRPIPGVSVLRNDTVAQNGSAGRQTNRRFYSPSYGIGSSGSYFKGRIRSMVGWRHDEFNSRLDRVFYNPITDQEYFVEDSARTYSKAELSAYNVGGVVHATKWLSASFNYAESYRISLGIGADGFLPGSKQGMPQGDGYEAGLRWSFLGGRLESNWVYYSSNQLRNRDVPIATGTVTTELAAFFPNIATSSRDTQTVNSSGMEFETVASLGGNFTLTWNLATTETETQDTIPELRAIQAMAHEAGNAIPITDAFIATIVDGTPVRGFTKVRSNLFGRYKFSKGSKLEGFMFGAGLQYREETFIGNLDRDRDGVAEQQWIPGYTLYNAMIGYSMPFRGDRVDFALNVNNLFDKDYYRATTASNASWGIGRTIRFSTTFRF